MRTVPAIHLRSKFAEAFVDYGNGLGIGAGKIIRFSQLRVQAGCGIRKNLGSFILRDERLFFLPEKVIQALVPDAFEDLRILNGVAPGRDCRETGQEEHLIQRQGRGRFVEVKPGCVRKTVSPVAEVYDTLLSGAALFMLDNEERKDIRFVRNAIIDNDITVLYINPNMLKRLNLKGSSLRVAQTVGERLSNFYSDEYRIINIYVPRFNL